MQTVRPSQTARKVALNILALGTKPGMEEVLPPGIVEATAKLLVASGAAGPGAVRFARTGMAVWLFLAFDWLMPGQFEAFAHRKVFFERQVRTAIQAGTRQVLVLGAGYDTLGWRLAPEFMSVRFFEIDHPATANLKAKGIGAIGQRPNLHLMAEDLSQRQLQDVLQTNRAWDVTAPTVIVAEGLLMYLPIDAVAALFQQCGAATGVGSRIAFTYVGTRTDGQPNAGPWTWLVLWLLKLGGEPWLWSIDSEELGSFLQENQWTLSPDPGETAKRCGVEFLGVGMK